MASMQFSATEKKLIFLSSLGGALEFYDFIIYIFLASELSELFFPAANHLASLIGVYAVFAVGYLIRPLGGIIFSHFGDKYGRKKTFVVTLIMMALPTFLIGLLPTYQNIGIKASLLLILLRLIQGLSVGGEIPGAVTFAGEHINPKSRGVCCALIFLGINIGLILGSMINVALFYFCTPEQVLSWGWRIPFIIGGLLGMVSFKLRRGLVETPIFKQHSATAKKNFFPIREVFANYKKEVFQGAALTWLDAVTVCLLFLYLPTYLTSILHYPKETINILNTIALILNSLLCITFGWLSDLFGRRRFLLLGSLCFVLFSYFFFYLLSLEQLAYVVIVMFSVSLLSACTSMYVCTIIELFPTSVRYTGMAITYNIGYAFFGGLTPLIATSLINTTHNNLSPSFYLILSAAICFFSALTLKNKHGQVLS
ncbi:MFS transporter [Legionella gresilensis]|uniref:MFS transporter n=1 Tax=Legionella gresilensis TaxID=91823 RepID=UPI0010418257|nr:MFS transporter [Legionella gresilensis]